MYLDIVDLNQGEQEDGRTYGYCGINDRGGQFFAWHPTLAATLASIEDDEIDPPQNWPRRAYQEVRGAVRRAFAAQRCRPDQLSLIPSV